MSVDWVSGLGRLYAAIAAARQRKQQEAYTNALRAFELYRLVDPTLQRDPARARGLLSQVEESARGMRGMEKFQFPREPGPVITPAQPATPEIPGETLQVPRGIARAGMTAEEQAPTVTTPATPGRPAQPEVRGPSPGIALPQPPLSGQRVRDVVTDPTRQQALTQRYGARILDVTVGDAIDVYGQQFRNDLGGIRVPTFAQAYPSVKWREPGAGDRPMVNPATGAPLSVTEQLKTIEDAGGVFPNVNRKRFETRVQSVTQNLDTVRRGLMTRAAQGTLTDQEVDAFNRRLEESNKALATDAQNNEFSFAGIGVQPIGSGEVAQAGRKEAGREARDIGRYQMEWARLGISQQQMAIAAAHLQISERQLQLKLAAAKDKAAALTAADREVLRLYNDPAATLKWTPAQKAALNARVSQVLAKLGIPDVTPDALDPPATPGAADVPPWRQILRWLAGGGAPAPAVSPTRPSRTPGAPPARPRTSAPPELTSRYPPQQYAGRTIRDQTTGKRYRSDGTRWVEVP